LALMPQASGSAKPPEETVVREGLGSARGALEHAVKERK
jgi:hypothetical protein